VSLLALIRLDPARAAGMCDLLSDLFARSVAASGVHEWPLREEIALTTDYLAVQHIRFGERLVVRTTVHPELHDRLIPRLLLQPLVENAVKHGVARREEPTHLTIAASEHRGTLHLEVVNDAGVPAVGPPAAGGGLTFVRSRVAAAGGTVDYDAAAPGTFRVCCVLPQPGRSFGVA
jgi:LytS/YehU family sensor histidine kinase